MPVLQLLEEIKKCGYTGSQNLLYRYITQGRVESDRPAISPKRLTRYLLTRPEKFPDHQRERLDAAVAVCPEMIMLAALLTLTTGDLPGELVAGLPAQQLGPACRSSWVVSASGMRGGFSS